MYVVAAQDFLLWIMANNTNFQSIPQKVQHRVKRETAFELKIPITITIYDPKQQMFTLHHQLLLVKKDDNGVSRFV